MSDREAFVAAIAANPADDLPRLVFADWLDEHGDPERAEFIRTQIRWNHTFDADERTRLNARTADLFREHWQRWFGPFIHSLDPTADLPREFGFSGFPNVAGYSTLSTGAQTSKPGPAVRRVGVCRGFVHSVEIDLGLWKDGASLAEAYRHEAPTSLTCRNGLHSLVWARFTDPALRRVTYLHLDQHWSWNVSAPESTALLEDPHLAGVRSFGLFAGVDTDEEQGPAAIPVAWLERFARSSLAYRLGSLSLSRVPGGGVVPLCRTGRLRLEDLYLNGPLTAADAGRLGASEMSRTVHTLNLWGELTDGVVAALCRDEWPKLTDLNLSHNRLTAAVLPALAAAAFTPRLKELDLRGNPLFTGEPDLSGLGRLADALDPERIDLDLRDTGLSYVPDFLAERFGDRVTV